jgi:YbbR domain-containing protein
MKEKLTRNIGLKVLSIILAALLWLFITNVDDPITEVPFDNVPVKILNEAEIVSQDKVYEILEGATIDFTVAARRSIADNLVVADFEVTADFSKLSDVNAVAINITCPRYGSDVNITEGLNQVMKINPEKLKRKNFKVTVVTKGEPAEGYYVGEKSANTIVTVSGAESKIERIKEVVAEVNVSEASETFQSVERLKAYDEEGEEVSNLSFSITFATIHVSIYKTKEIDLKIITTGNTAAGYALSLPIDYEPKKIEVAGKDEALDSIDVLEIKEDVTGARESIQKEINIQEKLPEGLIAVGGDQTVTVNITVEKKVTKEITILPGDIEIRNLDESLTLAYLSSGPITLKVTGLAKELENINKNRIRPYIDLKNYSYGTYSIAIVSDLTAPTVSVEEASVGVLLAEK